MNDNFRARHTFSELSARAQAGNRAPLRRVFKLDMSLAGQREAARQFARNFVSFNAAGDADRYRGLGLDDGLDRLRERYKTGASIEQSAELVSEKLIGLVVLAGKELIGKLVA